MVPTNLKYLLFGLLQEKCANLCSHTQYSPNNWRRARMHPPTPQEGLSTWNLQFYCRRNKGYARSEDAGDQRWLWILSWGSMIKSIVKGHNAKGQVSDADTLLNQPIWSSFPPFLQWFQLSLFLNFRIFTVTFFGNKTSLNSKKQWSSKVDIKVIMTTQQMPGP